MWFALQGGGLVFCEYQITSLGMVNVDERLQKAPMGRAWRKRDDSLKCQRAEQSERVFS
jgi:hypothetical protein